MDDWVPYIPFKFLYTCIRLFIEYTHVRVENPFSRSELIFPIRIKITYESSVISIISVRGFVSFLS